jgi:hypothetical protein
VPSRTEAVVMAIQHHLTSCQALGQSDARLTWRDEVAQASTDVPCARMQST